MIEAVRLVTRDDEQDYDQYIKDIKNNRIARSVKLADMRDNINLLRIIDLQDKDLQRCRKYHKYVRVLQE